MRIQHNIPALNSYRNYTNNNSALAKNLEKLSSGYRINRAGDDAAGLAISEKMRAQITGLNTAQKNAKDGISLVQTAEGALTEVHSMLNRMVELADQSANGTFDDKTDRNNLQKEVAQLKSEINRIADSSNFNGIKLLDGSLAGGTSGAGKTGAVNASTGAANAFIAGTAVAQESTATFAAAAAGDVKIGDSVTFKLSLSNGSTYEVSYKIAASGANGGKLVDAKGNDLGVNIASIAAGITNEEMGTAALTAFGKVDGIKEQFTLAASAGGDEGITLTAKNAEFGTPTITGLSVTAGNSSQSASAAVTTSGKGTHNVLDINSLEIYDAASSTKNAKNAIVTINGQKFAFAKNAASAKELGADVNVIITTAANSAALANADSVNLVNLINQKTGLNLAARAGGAADPEQIDLITYGSAGSSGGGLTLQIGDTAESFNQLSVSVQDMHATALGIDAVDVSTQGGAKSAVDMIKNAINSVSSVRGDLGATQNRLEHTINNLSVMSENIQDAEASIRDVDVAKEMMAYTKNNILVQSAQAMLAQANQLPQGVLQLLQ